MAHVSRQVAMVKSLVALRTNGNIRTTRTDICERCNVCVIANKGDFVLVSEPPALFTLRKIGI